MPQVICDLNTLDNIGDLKMLPCNDEWVTCTQDDTLSLGVLMLQLLTARYRTTNHSHFAHVVECAWLVNFMVCHD